MNKIQFLLELDKKLSSLPVQEKEERLRFYSEMIEDRTEEGLTEDEAVAAIGTVQDIGAQIIAEYPTQVTTTNKKRSALTILLLILGSPVWISLLAAAFAVVLSLYISLWAVVISLWAGFVSVAACGIAGVAAGIGFACGGHVLPGIAVIGGGLTCAGLSILFFFGCKTATKASVILTRKFFACIKKCLSKKEDA